MSRSVGRLRPPAAPALLTLLALAAPAAALAAPPPAAAEAAGVQHAAGFEITPAARQQLQRLQGEWLRWVGAADRERSQAAVDQMLATAKSDFEPDIRRPAFEEIGKPRRCGRCDIERQVRQQIVDQVGLMDAELVALAAAEERAMRMGRGAVIRRHVAVADVARWDDHRSVWYSRYNSRALGSIEEMYICS